MGGIKEEALSLACPASVGGTMTGIFLLSQVEYAKTKRNDLERAPAFKDNRKTQENEMSIMKK